MSSGEVGESAPNSPTGAVEFSKSLGCLYSSHFDKVLQRIDKNDLDRFQNSRAAAFSNMLLPVILTCKIDTALFANEEQRRLQRYYFDVYLQSCAFIRHDTKVDEILKDGVLDLDKFYELQVSDIHSILGDHISYRWELYSLHAVYAYRKGLVKCDFIKWDSNYDNVLENLKAEKRFPSLNDWALEIGLTQHLDRLQKWTSDKGAVKDVSLESYLLEPVNRCYFEGLMDLAQKSYEERKRKYLDHVKFQNLVAKQVYQVQALKTSYLPQSQPQSTMLSLVEEARLASMIARGKMRKMKKYVKGQKLGGLIPLPDEARVAYIRWAGEKLPKMKKYAKAGVLALSGLFLSSGLANPLNVEET